ncbi:hypothetical protein KA977_01555 [Candidatus Dependentiae bacterium]|nr:hypothetical protein [Candidatus Dependentiae bacterium]
MLDSFENFKNKALRQKTISVWGLGYLGYTTILLLQKNGFKVNVFDFNGERMELLKKNKYPELSQIKSWSMLSNCPALDISKITIVNDIKEMFNTNIHLVAIPNENTNLKIQNQYSEIADIFGQNFFENQDEKNLIIFLSASFPNSIKELFIEKMKDSNNIIIAAAFRNDWTIEKFFADDYKYFAAADDEKNLDYIRFFFKIMRSENFILFDNIKECELNENLRKVLEWGISSLCNQIMFAFPKVNIKKITKSVLKNMDLENILIKISLGGYKYPMAVRNIFKSAEHPEILTILKEIQSAELSEILQFVEFTKKNNIKNAAILGITTYSNKKEIEYSTSVILAEALNNAGINVFINDPLYSKKEINELFPDYNYFNIDKQMHKIEILFLMTSHKEYAFYTQKDLDEFITDKISYIVDNVGLWENMSFSDSVSYYSIGTGNLDILK